MYFIGIDVGSAYTKYCIMENGNIISLYSEKTPVRQIQYFENRLREFDAEYPGAVVVSCGYGKKNVAGINRINELTALAAGAYYVMGKSCVVLDIGGQDTKAVRQEDGKLREFFLNDKCAAGSGLFLMNTLSMLDLGFEDIRLDYGVDSVSLSSTCVVFAQSEIVELVADNVRDVDIVNAVIRHIFIKAKSLADKIETDVLIISGGLSQIRGIDEIASSILGRNCHFVKEGNYLSAIGCCTSIVN